MPATVIDDKALAAATKAEAAEKVRELKSRGINPCLAVILVGENPASQVYVRGKINDCAQCGIESRSINLPADTTQDALLAEVKKLADDSAVHGILVQLPLPAQIDEKAVIDTIPTGIIGGISFVLYGMISAIGVRNVVENRVDFTNSRNLIIAAVILVSALGFNSVGGVTFAIAGVNINLSGLAVAAIAGILLNAILPGNDYEFDAADGSEAATSSNLQV